LQKIDQGGIVFFLLRKRTSLPRFECKLRNVLSWDRNVDFTTRGELRYGLVNVLKTLSTPDSNLVHSSWVHFWQVKSGQMLLGQPSLTMSSLIELSQVFSSLVESCRVLLSLVESCRVLSSLVEWMFWKHRAHLICPTWVHSWQVESGLV
jgi:hypothetical protein